MIPPAETGLPICQRFKAPVIRPQRTQPIDTGSSTRDRPTEWQRGPERNPDALERRAETQKMRCSKSWNVDSTKGSHTPSVCVGGLLGGDEIDFRSMDIATGTRADTISEGLISLSKGALLSSAVVIPHACALDCVLGELRGEWKPVGEFHSPGRSRRCRIYQGMYAVRMSTFMSRDCRLHSQPRGSLCSRETRECLTRRLPDKQAMGRFARSISGLQGNNDIHLAAL